MIAISLLITHHHYLHVRKYTTMALKKIHYGPFSRIGDRYATFINPYHFLGRDANADTWIAPTNASKNEKGYDLEIMIPGFSRDEISLTIDNHTLAVSAQKKETSDKKYIAKQIPSSYNTRSFELPKNVDEDHILAKLENGILKIRIAEKSQNGRGRKVTVK